MTNYKIKFFKFCPTNTTTPTDTFNLWVFFYHNLNWTLFLLQLDHEDKIFWYLWDKIVIYPDFHCNTLAKILKPLLDWEILIWTTIIVRAFAGILIFWKFLIKHWYVNIFIHFVLHIKNNKFLFYKLLYCFHYLNLLEQHLEEEHRLYNATC